jgi:hypothetical protein
MRIKMLGLAAAGILAASMGTVAADRVETTIMPTMPYPDVADISHASTAIVEIFRDFFTVKSEHKPDALMAHFAKDKVLYIDASSGGQWPSWDALAQIFNRFLPTAKPAAMSYPTRIYGDAHSALVAFTDTPELFGHELRILGAVSFDAHGKIIRWIDYWDGRSSRAKNVMRPTYPTDFRDDVGNAGGKIHDVAVRLNAAFSAGDAAMAASMFSNDAAFEDMAMHAQILGRAAIERYFKRALVALPYGKDATLAHVVGSDLGGGYEWRPDESFSLRRGNTALELDRDGKIARLTTVYDSSLLPDPQYRALVLLSAEN